MIYDLHDFCCADELSSKRVQHEPYNHNQLSAMYCEFRLSFLTFNQPAFPLSLKLTLKKNSSMRGSISKLVSTRSRGFILLSH